MVSFLFVCSLRLCWSSCPLIWAPPRLLSQTVFCLHKYRACWELHPARERAPDIEVNPTSRVRLLKRHCSKWQKLTCFSSTSQKADVAHVRYRKAVDHHMPLQMDRTCSDQGQEGAKRHRDKHHALFLHLNLKRKRLRNSPIRILEFFSRCEWLTGSGSFSMRLYTQSQSLVPSHLTQGNNLWLAEILVINFNS